MIGVDITEVITASGINAEELDVACLPIGWNKTDTEIFVELKNMIKDS